MITIYIDLDGVLADFDSYWGDNKTFDKERFRREILDNNMFDKLEVLENSRKLLKDINLYCKKYNINYNFQILGSLGAPDNDDLANKIIQQKTDWVAKHFPNTFSNLNFVKHKKLKKFYASPDSLLIDDTKSNVDEFIKEGGNAFLWNDGNSYGEQAFAIVYIIKSLNQRFKSPVM